MGDDSEFMFVRNTPTLQMTTNQSDKDITIRNYFETKAQLPSPDMPHKAMRNILRFTKNPDLRFVDITPELLHDWLRHCMHRMSTSSVIRYLESLDSLYEQAVADGLAPATTMFSDQRRTSLSLCTDGGLDKRTTPMIEAVRGLALDAPFGITVLDVAVAVHLYSFYHGCLPIRDIVGLRKDTAPAELLQTQDLLRRYCTSTSARLFPLHQGRAGVSTICKALDDNFRKALELRGIPLEGRTVEDYLATAWAAAAKSANVPYDQIFGASEQVAKTLERVRIQPAALSAEQRQAVHERVANTIVDMTRHWYALRFTGDVRQLRQDLDRLPLVSPAQYYYPMEEVHRRVGAKRKAGLKPTIRNVLFVECLPKDLALIDRSRSEMCKYYVVRTNLRRDGQYAVIPNHQMRRFSALVSNGQDIIGEDELQNLQIVSGTLVHITDGLFKGYSGRVLKVRDPKKQRETTMLEVVLEKEMAGVLDKKIYITVAKEIVEKELGVK
jgi:hypothetical protein